jgi:hypothetical protein
VIVVEKFAAVATLENAFNILSIECQGLPFPSIMDSWLGTITVDFFFLFTIR